MRRAFVNPEEGRLRAGWRMLVQAALFVAVLGTIQILLVTSGLDLVVGERGISDPWRFLVVVLPAAVATAVSVAVAARRLDHRAVADFGLRLDPRWWQDLGAGLVIGALPMTAIFLVEVAAGWVTVRTWIGAADAPAAVSSLIAAALLMVLIGTYEEVLTRGYHLTNLAQGLRGLLGPRGAIIVAWLASAAAFGLLHVANPGATVTSTMNVAVAGAFLGLGYVLTGRLGVSIGAHIAWNFVQGPVFGFPVSGNAFSGTTVVALDQGGPARWTGGAFGPEAGLLGLGGAVLGSLLVLWWVRSQGSIELAEALTQAPRQGEGLDPAPSTEGTEPGPPNSAVGGSNRCQPDASRGAPDATEHQGPEDHEQRLRSRPADPDAPHHRR